LKEEERAIVERLEPLRSGDVKPVDPEQRKAVDNDLKVWRERERRRRKIVKEMWSLISESVGGQQGEEALEELKVRFEIHNLDMLLTTYNRRNWASRFEVTLHKRLLWC
jgi:hypothetical protein